MDDDHGGSTKDVKFGKIYHGKKGLCLVPAFDKKTGKFLGAIWVGCDEGIGGFFGFINLYSEYKQIVHSKSNHKSHSNNVVGASKSDYNGLNNSKPIKIDVVGKSNYNLLKNQDSIIDNNQPDLNSIEFISSDSYSEASTVDCTNETI